MLALRRVLFASLTFVSLCFGSTTVARADTVTLNAIDSGQYLDDGFHNAGNEDYAAGVGRFFSARNFFVFDLSGVAPGSITSATLRLFNPPLGYRSPDASEVYIVSDVTTPIPTLVAPHPGFSREGFLIFRDLGSGVAYGSATVSGADNNSMVILSLNAASLSALNANAGGLFAIGGRIGQDTNLGVDRVIFLGSGVQQGARQLVFETTAVPEPATMLLLGTSLAAVAVEVRRRRRRSST